MRRNNVPIPWHILEDVADAFYNRFNSTLEIDDLRYPDESQIDTSLFTFNELD